MKEVALNAGKIYTKVGGMENARVQGKFSAHEGPLLLQGTR